ncbi:LCP family protein [Priestia taiwanensis]|uniref:LytR family transcriptional regulator n=1 Tax=Priestia taiwanensis TaxID=1347902 RepID=A0A917EPK1_9BACI|nr:LCP family protein [Priestia taiwanensis]MBM7363063.1 LCP family protein required for cell wall assembly [Priestia taiwanensis]GGE67318.1 LytR family transcriptional regulator [Priestia taiwanensis]
MNRKVSVGQNRRKVKTRRMVVIIVLLMLVLGGVGYGGYLVYKASSAVKNAEQTLGRGGKSDLRDSEVKPVENHVSVLLMGVDESPSRAKEQGNAVHTDALMLATFNTDDKTVKLVSIPRDMYTYIPISSKVDKITHAHSEGQVRKGKDGGPDATVNAVEGLLNIPVDYYLKFNFASFIDIVNELGGIEIDVPADIVEQDSSGIANAIRLEKGIQTLNGEEALALARTRHMDSDAMRGQRQQLVLEAIVKKAASVGSVTEIGDIIDVIDGNFKTNLSLNDMMAFYKYGIGASIEKLQIEGQDAYIRNGSKKQAYSTYHEGTTYYYLPDKENLDKITKELRIHLGLSERYSQKYTQNNEVIKVTKTD